MVSCGVMLYFRPLLSSLVVMGERDCEERLTIYVSAGLVVNMCFV